MSGTDEPRSRLPLQITLSLREARVVVAAIAGALDQDPSVDELRRAGRLLASKLWPLLGPGSARPRGRSG